MTRDVATDLNRATMQRLQRDLVHARWATRWALEEARTDPLTGLGNRRRMEERTREWIAAGARFAVVLFDMANLKAANDALGHVGADALLVEVGRHLRGYDLAVRTGGDEFAVLLPGASADSALAVRDRIEAAFGLRRLGGRSVFLAGGSGLWDPHGPDLGTVLLQADRDAEARKAALKRRLGEPVYRTEAKHEA